MSVVLSEHLPLLASAPDGIRKLRGLILELAVRGKLVLQDPDDEPASELLKRIAQERGRRESGTTRQKNKVTPPVSDDDQPFELPLNWCWCRFPDVAAYRMGKTPPTKDAAYWSENGTPWVSIADMVHGETVLTTSRTVSNAAQEKVFKAAPAPAGTLLMSFKLTVGKVATLGTDAFHNEAIISIFPFAGISQAFLSHFLPMIAKGGNSKSALMGDTLNSESLSLLAIPLPPLAEQQRIVAKVDELMALCDRLEAEQADAEATHAKLVETLLGTLTQSSDTADFAANWQRLAAHFHSLFTTGASLDALKQTIRQLAVMGKLVPQDANDEPAGQLLNRIAQERARLESEGVCKRSKPLPPVRKDEQPFKLPYGWAWARFAQIAAVNGRLVDSQGYPEAMQVAPDSIEKGTGRLIEKRSVRDSGVRGPNQRFQAGQLLYSKIRPSLSKAVIVDFGGLCSADMYPLDPYIEPRFLLNQILSELFLEQVRVAENRVKMPKLNQESLNAFVVCIPPLAEQHRIVAKVDELIALIDRLKADLADTRARQARLATTLIETALHAA